MGATFSRLKNWIAEVLTYADLNAEIDNILTYFVPSGMDDMSANAAAMQTTTDAGEVGSESLPTSLAGEVERLRFAIKEIKGSGVAQWYSSSSYSLTSLATALGGGIPNNRIVSCRIRSTSSQPVFLVPSGAAKTITLKGATTNFVYSVAGTQYTISSDVTQTGLTAAPSSSNTCLVNDTSLDGSSYTKYVGENGSDLIVDTMGTNISNLTGQIAGFKIGAEYFIARVESSTKLTGVMRGYFFDSADAPLPRVAISDNDTITLMKLTWVFATTAGALALSYNNPRVGSTAPTSTSDQYWFDTSTNLWKTYSAGSWSSASSILVGICLQDATNTVAARSFDIFTAYDATNTIRLELADSATIRSVAKNDKISVYGNAYNFSPDYIRWDMTTDLDTGLTEAASTLYFFYIKETGASVISTIAPYWRPDLLGYYHPHQSWRCVGQANNDASSNLEAVISYSDNSPENFVVTSAVAAGALSFKLHAPLQTPIRMKSATAGSGEREKPIILPDTAFTVTSAATLGTTSGAEAYLHLSALSVNKRVELGISRERPDDGTLINATAMSASATASTIVYAKATQASIPISTLSRIRITEATAGNWATTPAEIATGHFAPIQRSAIFTASGNWTCPFGVSQVLAIVQGGGGGGGGGATTFANGGGGGGAGAYVVKMMSVTPGSSYTVNVGALATGGGASQSIATNGSSGNDSFFDVITARGGGGGLGATTIAGTGGAYRKGPQGYGGVFGYGGDGGSSGTAAQSGSLSDFSFAGGAGGGTSGGGGGAASGIGVGADGGTSGNNGSNAAANTGAGGGGGAFNSNGGNGGSGLVALYWEGP